MAAASSQPLDQTDAVITLVQLRDLIISLGGLSLPERKEIGGLPPARADVFPTALATLIAVAEVGGFDSDRNSLFNLRYGLAVEALDGH